MLTNWNLYFQYVMTKKKRYYSMIKGLLSFFIIIIFGYGLC